MSVKRRRAPGAVSVPVGTLVAALVVAIALGLPGCGQRDVPAGDGAEEEPREEGNATPSVEWIADGVITAGEYSGEMDKGTYRLYWTRAGEVIRIGMEAETEGWVAVGIQPGSAMNDADIIIGFVGDSGTFVSDEFSSGRFGPHGPDTDLGGSDDIIDFGGSETGDVTVIEFSRKLDTGDEYDNPVMENGATAVIWAYGTADDSSLQHGTRGYGEIVLDE